MAGADQTATLTMQDKDNIKQIMDMFSGQYNRDFVKSVYLSEGKNSEKTLDRFLNQNLPEQPKIVVEVNKVSQIDTSQSVQSRQKENLQKYVIEEYRDILFPKKESKFAKQAQMDHQRALAQSKMQEDSDNLEVRRKIIELASMMQYDDDIEESQVKTNF